MELVTLKYAYSRSKLQNALKEPSKTNVVDLNLHEIKNDILGEKTGEFDFFGTFVIEESLGNTHIRFENIEDFEAYIFSIDQGYEFEDALFDGFINKIDKPEFNMVNRFRYGNGCDFRHQIVEYRGDNCFISSKV